MLQTLTSGFVGTHDRLVGDRPEGPVFRDPRDMSRRVAQHPIVKALAKTSG